MTRGDEMMTSKKVNDFCITVSTINGSGSATANSLLLKAIFKMGVFVSGKNIFPSNIQGLPTWYSIRVNQQGFMGRVEHDDIIIAMNPETIQSDLSYLQTPGLLLYDEDIILPEKSNSINAIPMPIATLISQSNTPSNLKTYLSNMVYVGILAFVLNIDLKKISEALYQHFNGKEVAIEPNKKVIDLAYQWAESEKIRSSHFEIKPMNQVDGFIMTCGNTAASLGAIYGGVQFVSWYPITPASSLPEALNEYLPKLRKDPTTKKCNYVSLQAEDELAAIGMAVGAGWSGLRSMTATSGPGLCLMSEYLGLAYQSEIPVVVWDVQRVGPSTGLPTHTSQGDLTFSYFLSHGDTDFVILLPGSVHECFEFAWKALDIAEQLQTPVLVLSDLDLGMNDWITPEFSYPDTPVKRGKILWEEDLSKLLEKRGGDWGRFVDLDTDGIPYRTVPGNSHQKAAYFARGTGHDEYGRYSEAPQVWERMQNRLLKKFESAKNIIPSPIIHSMKEKSKLGIIAYGSNDVAVIEAISLLQKHEFSCDYLRIRAIPFTREISTFLESHEKIYVAESNRDGQLAQLLRMNFPSNAEKIISIAHVDGLALSAEWIVSMIWEKGKKKNGSK